MDDRSVIERVRDWYRLPFPVRIGDENPFRFIADSIVALFLWIGGCGIAGFCHQKLPFPEPIAYTVGLIIGWFPIGMWIHYCRVSSFSVSKATVLIILLLTINAALAGMQGLLSLPLASIILVVVLRCEHLVGKLIIGWLPTSSTRKQSKRCRLE